MIDFEAHPASVILFAISGYHVSPDRIRQLAREKGFSIKTTKGKSQWNWKFVFDNGPILVPFAYKIDKAPITVSYSIHSLNWKQDPPPAEDERGLEALANEYDMDFVYIDANAQLPMSDFFPYNNLEEICRDYDARSMSTNRLIDFLEKLFQKNNQIRKSTYFKWNKDLTEFYKKTSARSQMFRYSYVNSHEFQIHQYLVYSEKPARNFHGPETHPWFLGRAPFFKSQHLGGITLRVIHNREHRWETAENFPRITSLGNKRF